MLLLIVEPQESMTSYLQKSWLKIIVKEGDACSLQGTDPVTKRPLMFEGEVLGVFGEYVCVS